MGASIAPDMRAPEEGKPISLELVRGRAESVVGEKITFGGGQAHATPLVR